MDHRHRLATSFLILIILLAISSTPFSVKAQEGPYRFTPAPDIWYNDVDGIRLGVRVLGEMEDSFKDGPHRLDAGVWFGTKIPDLPVSYYLAFTEPIPFISDFGEEGNIRLRSSVRTGFSKHGISFNKRFQVGFDETRYQEFSVGLSTEKMFDEEYRQYPEHWILTPGAYSSEEWIQLFNAAFLITDRHSLGPFLFYGDFDTQLNGDEGFSRLDLQVQQRVPLGNGFGLSLRGFFGTASEETPYQYSYLSSMESMVSWLDHGISRAQGTIPMGMFNSGFFQYPGGPNLRGYLDQDIDRLKNQVFLQEITDSDSYLMTSARSVNVELDFPYPYEKKLRDTPIIGDFFEIRNYLFYDVGVLPDSRYNSDSNTTKSNLGIGFQFSFNIPDYLGKDRGIFISYDIPFWLSHPEADNPNFKFRSLLGIGAIISL